MKIQYTSDLRIEYPENKAFLKENTLKPVGECLQFLQGAFTSSEVEKKVIISHHAPTFMNYPEAYRGDVLNEAFGVELFDFIEHNQPDLWIYGHTHGNVSDFNIGKTRLGTNQLGYLRNNEHVLFDNGKIFEL